MNLSALPQMLATWVKTQGAALLEPGKSIPPAGKELFQPGASYQGKVLDGLSGGRNLVQVGGQQVSMALPKGVQAGDTIRLTYLHNMPRPTFVMEQPAIGAVQPVRLSQTAQQLTALAQLAQPKPGSGPPPTTPSAALLAQAGMAAEKPILSTTLALTGALASTGTSGAPVSSLTGAFASATALTGNSPVGGTGSGLAAGSATTNLAALQAGVANSQTVLPQRLQQTLRESGMFYEAHLARWTRGTYDLKDLRNEPQARLANGSHAMAAATGLTGMTEEAARLAGRQLQMLEGGPFFWQGFAWPGQWLEWDVREQPAGVSGEGDQPNTWATELRLTLPQLGGVSARLSLAGDRLTIGLNASEGLTREALGAALPELEEALLAAGLNPAGLSIIPNDGPVA